MELVSDNLRKCGVKISTFVAGVPSLGSGVVYETPNYCSYNYILTAKHIFQEDSQTDFEIEKLDNINIFYSDGSSFKKLQCIKKKSFSKNLLIFEDDLVILIIDKNEEILFCPILVTDNLQNDESEFFSWTIFKANEDQLNFFNFKRNDNLLKRIELTSTVTSDSIYGMSGGGVFIKDKNILYGIISKYPNEDFENSTIDCTHLSFEKINYQLKSWGRIQLDTKASPHKREINNKVVDIHQAYINNVYINLELARKRLKTDIIDDWYHDPLKYIDLLNQDYLFKQFESNFENNSYEASEAEKFYVPKKGLTSRQALISPFIDRIIYMALVGVVAQRMDDSMIPNVYSARYNKFSQTQLIINGVEQWKKMQYIIAENANLKDSNNEYKYNCIIEVDLLNYYDNIDKNLLIEKIERVCITQNEKNACVFLQEFLMKISCKSSGLPQNSDASALLASFYLNQVDLIMYNSTFGYYRFMDDIRIFCKDEYEARGILQKLEYELRRCHLSVNSQKTAIKKIKNTNIDLKDKEVFRGEFEELFDLKLNQISKLRSSSNYQNKNIAFHESKQLLNDNIEEDLNNNESARRLNYALNTIESLGRKTINLYSTNADFKKTLLQSTKSLYDKPWMTTQICKVLNLVEGKEFIDSLSEILKNIIINKKYNTYSFQSYQIWLLLAKHKFKDRDLIQFAVKAIEENDETNRAGIAAMITYICSVDNNYRRVICRKFAENFTHGYFQNRAAMISLRSFDSKNIPQKHIHASLKYAPEFTNRFKTKDLVYIHGFDEEENNEVLDQLYSI